MNETNRPLSVTILASVFLLVGTMGFVFHFRELLPIERNGLVIEFTEILAVVAGWFMFRGQNWARWLGLAWMAFHVAISIFDPLPKLLAHAVIFALISWILLRPAAGRYFRRNAAQPV